MHEESKWLYQTPIDILIKASNGASDFGNKFGQPLICGSLLTFEHEEKGDRTGFDKVIMLAGGVGYGKADMAHKGNPQPGDRIIMLGGDNYRIGMGGAAVSSTDTGQFSDIITLNAVQRSNPEMQKRVADAIRGMVEAGHNPVISIHDHGAGGHLNCFSELVEESGGAIDLDRLPIGDPTLSSKEIIGNESQERMGLIISGKDLPLLGRIAERERAPMYDVGEVTGDMRFTFYSSSKNEKPIDLELSAFFGSSPKTVMKDQSVARKFDEISYRQDKLPQYLKDVLRLEAVACKDWLTNKVDRCVGGRVAKQQCAGSLQLPLNNVGVMALDFEGVHGVATSIGHAPVRGLINAAAGARNSIAEALTNIVWAPFENGLSDISLSANWMWPCNNPGEDSRLYEAVEAASEFAIALGINIPTGKDSLSMKQRYADRDVLAPGTVIISATAHCSDIRKVVEPVAGIGGGPLFYIDMSSDLPQVGGTSFAQVLHRIGNQAGDTKNAEYFSSVFNALQDLIKMGAITAGHDIGSGGLITTLLEMCFSDINVGLDIDLTALTDEDTVKLCFSENVGVVVQVDMSDSDRFFIERGITAVKLGEVNHSGTLVLKNHAAHYEFDIDEYRDAWFETSYLLDVHQSGEVKARERFENYKHQPLEYIFPDFFDGHLPALHKDKQKPLGAVLREKGSNSERELAQRI
jgi:phosphoribosylformylglycinamidine synthase